MDIQKWFNDSGKMLEEIWPLTKEGEYLTGPYHVQIHRIDKEVLDKRRLAKMSKEEKRAHAESNLVFVRLIVKTGDSDFSHDFQFDVDKDGKVENISFVHVGPGKDRSLVYEENNELFYSYCLQAKLMKIGPLVATVVWTIDGRLLDFHIVDTEKYAAVSYERLNNWQKKEKGEPGRAKPCGLSYFRKDVPDSIKGRDMVLGFPIFWKIDDTGKRMEEILSSFDLEDFVQAVKTGLVPTK